MGHDIHGLGNVPPSSSLGSSIPPDASAWWESFLSEMSKLTTPTEDQSDLSLQDLGIRLASKATYKDVHAYLQSIISVIDDLNSKLSSPYASKFWVNLGGGPNPGETVYLHDLVGKWLDNLKTGLGELDTMFKNSTSIDKAFTAFQGFWDGYLGVPFTKQGADAGAGVDPSTPLAYNDPTVTGWVGNDQWKQDLYHGFWGGGLPGDNGCSQNAGFCIMTAGLNPNISNDYSILNAAITSTHGDINNGGYDPNH